MAEPEPDFLAVLHTFTEHEVDFIVVGGVCAALHGAPISTFDLDLVHSRAPDNIDRLLKTLDALDARYRARSERALRPDRSHLSSPGHQLLMTRAGPLDLLGAIGNDQGYAELLDHAEEMAIGEGLTVRLLNLATLIRLKEATAREKDRAVLAILHRTLEEQSRV